MQRLKPKTPATQHNTNMSNSNSNSQTEILLRRCELRLLRCTLLPPPSPAPEPEPELALPPAVEALLVSIEGGRYMDALRCPAASRLASDLAAAAESDADRLYSEFLRRVDFFLEEEEEEEKGFRVVTVMCIAVAAFLAFIQSNITGPLEEGMPKCPLVLRESNGLGEWDSWATYQLMSAGSDLLAKFSHLQYIVFAKMLLMRIRDLITQEFRSISWWLARLLLTQQRILDDRSSSLFDLLQVFTQESFHHFGTLETLTSYWGTSLLNDEGLAIVSMVHLEAGIMEYTYGRVDACRLHFESAEAAAGLELSVTGVLGFRTLHQVEPKAQMVLVANRNLSNSSGNCQSDSSGPQKQDANGDDKSSSRHPEESDIYITPKLLEKDNGRGMREEGIQVGNAAVPLSAVHQAVILARCLLIEKTTPHDDMQRWDMAPYIEAIDSQQSSCFTIRSFCDVLRIRWESNRSRTKERALTMMDKLVQGMYQSSPGVEHRVPFCHGVWIPPIALLRKEYGEILIRCGLIGEAVKIFEDLELWDNLIFCYRVLEKKAAAVELIKARLSVMPNDPRLWCSLGDVTNNDACYEKALEVSDNKSARAKRSLARSAYNRGEYEASKVLWESAMALNSLYPDGWFALGAAALKAKDLDKAVDGFTRAVQLDPDNGEAWNNIACLHMMRKKSKESFIAFKEALKFKRNSWQLWENYGQVALDTGNISQALEAVRMVLELTNNKRIDTELLERVTTEVEKRASASPSMSSGIVYENELSGEALESRSRETKQLVDFLGKVLQLAVRSGNGGDIWGLYARWHKLKGDLTMCSEALLKQVRSYQGSDLWKDRDQFRKFAQASLELCKVYIEISSSTGSRKELFTAEMHLKNTIKQAVSFSNMEEFRHLQACLEEVQGKLRST